MRNLFTRIPASVVVSLALVFLVTSCGPSRQPEADIAKIQKVAPSELSAEVGHERALLRWKTNRGDALITGYNIYLSDQSVTNPTGTSVGENARRINDNVYPGDTDPDTEYETFEATDLVDGQRYYCTLTTVYLGNVESPPSNMTEFICHPSGECSLRQRYSGERDGYSFEQAEYVESDDTRNQIYYALIGGEDYLLSPSRLDSTLEPVMFHSLSIRSIKDGFEMPSGEGAERIRIVESMGCLMKTEDGKLAKIVVNGFSGSGDDREVHLEFSYMPVPGVTDF